MAILVSIPKIPDYSLKKEPVLTAGKLGRGANELNAKGIAFDESTELMYIVETGYKNIVGSKKHVLISGVLITGFHCS